MKIPFSQNGIRFRRLDAESDSFEEITHLLHRAYKKLLDIGLHYVATKQSVTRTRRRCLEDECFVACRGKQIVGVIGFEKPLVANGTNWYDRPEVACFSQFAVEPEMQGKGIGRVLLNIVEARAFETGAFEIALDTAIPAKHLVRYYKQEGYRVVDEHQWRGANYKSCIMSKRLIEKPVLADERPRIVVFGTVCADHVHTVEQFPELGRYSEINSERENLGGEAANTATNLADWSAEHLLIGNAIGNDGEGRHLRSQLKKLKVNSLIPVSQNKTPRCDIFVDSNGQRTMFGRGFAGFTHKDFDFSWKIKRGEWLTIDPNCKAGAIRAIQKAGKVGANLYAMDAIDESILEAIAEGGFGRIIWQSSTDWCGKSGAKRLNLGFVLNWSEQHQCDAILTDGAHGVFICEAGRTPKHFPALPVSKVLDATGAGDVFRAGVLYQLAAGSTLKTAILFAQAAAAHKCGHWGATTHQHSIEEIWDFALNCGGNESS